MKSQSVPQWLSLSLAAGVLLSATALAQQKYQLKGSVAAGDLSSVDSSEDMSLTFTVKANGDDAGQFVLSKREREVYTEQTVAATAKGPSVLRRTYSVARGVDTDPTTGQEHQRTSSLQGKTVVIRREGDVVKVSADKGQLAAADRKALHEALDHSDMDLMPDHDVAPGDEWSVDPKFAASAFEGLDKADIKCRFVEVAQHAGRQCAHVQINLELTGEPEGSPGPITMKLSGDMYEPLDLHRSLGVDLNGPITLTGRQAKDGVTLFFQGDGTMRIHETRRWLKVNGKAIAAK
jgi:hypothetical protein